MVYPETGDMHEMGIAMQIVDAVAERAGDARVRSVRVDVGKLAAVLPDALRFCWDLACAGTVAEGSALDIHEVAGLARCRDCGAELELERPFGRCDCGGTDLEWLRGEELRIRSMELV